MCTAPYKSQYRRHGSQCESRAAEQDMVVVVVVGWVE